MTTRCACVDGLGGALMVRLKALLNPRLASRPSLTKHAIAYFKYDNYGKPLRGMVNLPGSSKRGRMVLSRSGTPYSKFQFRTINHGAWSMQELTGVMQESESNPPIEATGAELWW
ncbi:MAG: hypothetical protein ACOVLE_12885 [Pirellula staleyi]